jgi:hypothetical protein
MTAKTAKTATTMMIQIQVELDDLAPPVVVVTAAVVVVIGFVVVVTADVVVSGATGVTEFEADEAIEVPVALIATTLNE